MTPEERQAIRGRVNNATSGPWEWTSEIVDCDPETGPFGEPSAVYYHTGEFYTNCITKQETDLHGFSVGSDADAEFIAHAREDVPKLLDEIECLTKEINRVKLSITWRSVKRWREHFRRIKAYESEIKTNDWELECAVEAIKDCVNHARQALEGDSE